MRCDVAKKKSQTYSCKEHSDCVDRIINGTSSGGYTCRCMTGYDENPCISDGCQGISISMFVLLVGFFWLYCGMKRRKFEQLKEKYFKENDGEKL
ncbi:hypothetical protein RchiOBHm_Chr1g0324581 [Rosa chinensis]|uniref:EGF-like domain-containing protein n=1 Tax=Rosa chinensis TaxID=74649 RepID=A0A2P6S9U1_ROSCH|nr:hypothetical protein RchiOBHm_Chr1g0324581 [Rosa chinensis]